MKILVTGATGFVGKFLVNKLSGDGHEVYGLTRTPPASSEAAPAGTKYIQGDLTDIETLYSAVENKDYVFHLAIAKSPPDIASYYSVNSLGTENLIKACHKKNRSIKKFIYVSSLAAAGHSPSGVPLTETDSPHPVTHYGKSKLKGEEAVLAYKDRLPVVILRPPTIIGPGNLFFNYIWSLIQRGIKPLWKGYTSLCYIDDFVESLLLTAERKEAEAQIYFVCDGISYSWGEIINVIASHSQRKKHRVHIPRLLMCASIPPLWAAGIILRKVYLASKPMEFARLYWLCDPSKIKQNLGFQCKWDFNLAMNAWHAALE